MFVTSKGWYVTTPPKKESQYLQGNSLQLGFSFSTLFPYLRWEHVSFHARCSQKSQKTSASFSSGILKALVVWHVVFRVQEPWGFGVLGFAFSKAEKIWFVDR